MDSINVHEIDAGSGATVLMILQVPNIIEMLTGFFYHGFDSAASYVYPSYENIIDGMPVIVHYVNRRGETRILQSLAPPEADPPPIGAHVTVFVGNDDTYTGDVTAAEALETVGDRGGRSLYISIIDPEDDPLNRRT
jgi:hypothetical protein